MRGAIKIALVLINLALTAFLAVSVWKLRDDFAGHWHYTFSETSINQPNIPSLLSGFPTQRMTVTGKAAINHRRAGNASFKLNVD
mgnify:FL=1